MADELTRDSEVLKATVTHVRKSGRQTRKDWQAYPVRSHRRGYTAVTTNCEKSAEAIVGKDLARMTAYCGDRYYWIATKTCVVRVISKDVLAKAGLISCLDYYNKRHALKLC